MFVVGASSFQWRLANFFLLATFTWTHVHSSYSRQRFEVRRQRPPRPRRHRQPAPLRRRPRARAARARPPRVQAPRARAARRSRLRNAPRPRPRQPAAACERSTGCGVRAVWQRRRGYDALFRVVCCFLLFDLAFSHLARTVHRRRAVSDSASFARYSIAERVGCSRVASAQLYICDFFFFLAVCFGVTGVRVAERVRGIAHSLFKWCR